MNAVVFYVIWSHVNTRKGFDIGSNFKVNLEFFILFHFLKHLIYIASLVKLEKINETLEQ